MLVCCLLFVDGCSSCVVVCMLLSCVWLVVVGGGWLDIICLCWFGVVCCILCVHCSLLSFVVMCGCAFCVVCCLLLCVDC